MGEMQALTERYETVKQRIADAAKRSGRRAEDVLLLAVTKHAAPEQIRHLINLGHQDMAENRVQQLEQRVAMTEEYVQRRMQMAEMEGLKVNPQQVRWHMIGHLQRNKVKHVLPLVKLIHSVDSLRLAEELHVAAEKQNCEVEVLLQVNASGEQSKYGITPPAAPHLAEQMETMGNIHVRGLMTMAPFSDNPENARPTFERTAELFNDMKKIGLAEGKFNLLSMGMSNDYEVAVECGANMLRVGTSIFGPPSAD